MVATPYANGILELARERSILDDVHKDLMGLQVCLHTRSVPTLTACIRGSDSFYPPMFYTGWNKHRRFTNARRHESTGI